MTELVGTNTQVQRAMVQLGVCYCVYYLFSLQPVFVVGLFP